VSPEGEGNGSTKSEIFGKERVGDEWNLERMSMNQDILAHKGIKKEREWWMGWNFAH